MMKMWQDDLADMVGEEESKKFMTDAFHAGEQETEEDPNIFDIIGDVVSGKWIKDAVTGAWKWVKEIPTDEKIKENDPAETWIKGKNVNDEIQCIKETYQDLLEMSYDEKVTFIRSNAAKEYFERLEYLKDRMNPEKNLAYRLVLFGDSTPYGVLDDGTIIAVTPPDISDPTSSYWNYHVRPEPFYGDASELANAPLQPYLVDLFSTKYYDPSTRETVDLGKGSYLSIAEDAYKRYKRYIGNDIDPNKNIISVLTGEGLESGDNLFVEYAKLFVEDKLPYIWGGDDLFEGADCSGFVQSIYKDFGIKIPGHTGGIATNAKKGNCVSFVKGPCMSETGSNSKEFERKEEEAQEAIKDFCDALALGDLILFDLGSRNKKYYGEVDHVVMYAGNGMIVEQYSSGHNAYYRPIEELIFNNSNWESRLPVYGVSYMTEEQRERFTVPEA